MAKDWVILQFTFLMEMEIGPGRRIGVIIFEQGIGDG